MTNRAWDSAPLRPRLSPGDFKRYIHALSRYFRFISLGDALEMLLGVKELQPNCLVLTFDDAYLSNATTVWPILKEYHATAAFFIPTGHIGTGKLFWVDRLDYALRHLPAKLRSLRLGDNQYTVVRNDWESLRRLFWRVKDACSTTGSVKAEQMINEIEDMASSTLADSIDKNTWAGFMTWKHIQSLQKEGATIGSHTVAHRLLDELQPDELMRELTESRREIESRTCACCSYLAYPQGRYTPEVVQMARDASYRCAVTTVEKPACVSDSVMMLPRIGIPRRSLSTADLLARVTGLSGALSRVRASLMFPKRRPGPEPYLTRFRTHTCP